MKNKTHLKQIEESIYLIRGRKVMLDSDLARLYGVETKVLNQDVKRNRDRFPEEFMFQLTQGEKNEVVTNCDHLHRLKFSPYLPFAFTEHGVLMLANVLKSPGAVRVSIQVVKAFVRLRQVFFEHKELSQKLNQMERKLEGHDQQIHALFEAIRRLMAPPSKRAKQIGFR